MTKNYSLASARSSAPTRDNDNYLAEELSKLLSDNMSAPGGANEPAPAGEYLCGNLFITERSKARKIKHKRRNRKALAV